MSTLNLDLELLRKTLNGAGILPGLESRSSLGTSTRHWVGPHAMASRSGLTIGPILVAVMATYRSFWSKDWDKGYFVLLVNGAVCHN